MHWIKDQSGISMLKVLIVLVVLGIGISEGIKYIRVQMNFHGMKDTMTAQAAAAPRRGWPINCTAGRSIILQRLLPFPTR